MIDTLPSVELADPFIVSQVKKEMSLCAGLSALTEWHRSVRYAAMLDAIYGRGQSLTALDQVPYLPTRIFKHLELMSVPRQAVVRQLTSSGTTGQQVSRIFLDAETSALQVRALAAIVQSFLGKQRLPMLIVDQQECVRGKAAFGAREQPAFWDFPILVITIYMLWMTLCSPGGIISTNFLERFHGNSCSPLRLYLGDLAMFPPSRCPGWSKDGFRPAEYTRPRWWVEKAS